MATKKTAPVETVEVPEVVEAEENMTFIDPLTTTAPVRQAAYNGPYVPVFLPALEDNGSGGLKVDQYEHVTIANEQKETCWKVLRGETVEVPVPVYILLKQKYPKI